MINKIEIRFENNCINDFIKIIFISKYIQKVFLKSSKINLVQWRKILKFTVLCFIQFSWILLSMICLTIILIVVGFCSVYQGKCNQSSWKKLYTVIVKKARHTEFEHSLMKTMRESAFRKLNHWKKLFIKSDAVIVHADDMFLFCQ